MCKNFREVNDENQKLLTTSGKSDVMQRFLNAVSTRNQVCSDLASDWARGYAGVQQIQYATDGTITDVTPDNAISTVDAVINKAIGSFQSAENQAINLNNMFDLQPGLATSVTLDDAKTLLKMLGCICLDDYYIQNYLDPILSMGLCCDRGGARRFIVKRVQSPQIIFDDMQYPVALELSASDFASEYTPNPGQPIIDGNVLSYFDNQNQLQMRSAPIIATAVSLTPDHSIYGYMISGSIPVFYTNTDGHIILTHIVFNFRLEHGWTGGSYNTNFMFVRSIDNRNGTVWATSTQATVGTSIDVSSPYINAPHDSVIRIHYSGTSIVPVDANALPNDIEVQAASDLFTLLAIPKGDDMLAALNGLLEQS